MSKHKNERPGGSSTEPLLSHQFACLEGLRKMMDDQRLTQLPLEGQAGSTVVLTPAGALLCYPHTVADRFEAAQVLELSARANDALVRTFTPEAWVAAVCYGLDGELAYGFVNGGPYERL